MRSPPTYRVYQAVAAGVEEILQKYHGQPYRTIYRAFSSLRHKLGRAGSELQRRRYLARMRRRTDAVLSAVLVQQTDFPEVANLGMELVLRRKALESELWISQRDLSRQDQTPGLTRIMHEDEIFVTAVAQSERFT